MGEAGAIVLKYKGQLMMNQQHLSKIFELAEEHRLKNKPPVEGWGSNRHGDKDSLWNVTSNTQYERDHPNGEWAIVPPLGSDTYAGKPDS